MLNQYFAPVPVSMPVLLLNLDTKIGKLDLHNDTTMNVNNIHAADVGQLVRRGNDQQINFGDDVPADDKKEMLEDARVGTRSELADLYQRRKDMRAKGTFDKAAQDKWEAERRELKRGAHKSLKEHNKVKLMLLNTDNGDFLLI